MAYVSDNHKKKDRIRPICRNRRRKHAVRQDAGKCGDSVRLHTFIVCAYGDSPYLRDCVESLERQTVRSRILIATSTPNDDILHTAEEFGLETVINEKRTGISEDWNFALMKASTPLVTLAHQDDIYDVSYTERILKEFRRNKDTVILFTDYQELRQRDGKWVSGQSRLLHVKHIMLWPLRWKPLQKSRWIRRRILSLGNPVCCPSVTYVKKRIPAPLFQGSMKSNIDWQAWERLSKEEGAFVYIPEPLMKHRIHDSSTTAGLVDGHARREEDLYMYRKFWPGKIPELLWRLYGKNEQYQ